jgi:protein-S-isoprenylcysteine O-methyltransferase Ste14
VSRRLYGTPSRRSTAAAYGLVAAQFGLLAALLVWRPARRWAVPAWLDRGAALLGGAGAVWLVLGAVALGRSISAVPLPVAHGELRTGGVYRLSRHPIYTGLLALAWSAAVRAGAPGPLGVAAALTVLLAGKAGFEERGLRAAYPGYAAYAARTPRFIPLGPLGAWAWGRRSRPARPGG